MAETLEAMDPHRHRRPARAAVAAALSSLLVAAGCGALGPSYGDELATPAESTAEQVAEVGDGELAVTPEDDRFVVQWRDPDGSGWTSPTTLAEGPGLDPSGADLTVGGDTAAVGLRYYGEDDDERETYARLDAAICRDQACDAVREDVSGSPMISADGDHAVVADEPESDGDGADPAYEIAVWDAGDGEWDDAVVEDVPAVERYRRPELVLLGDGSLATVRAAEGPDGCRYDLWAGAPRSTELEVVGSTDPVGGPGCGLQDVTTDGSSVAFVALGIDQTVTFRRDGDGWSDDGPGSTLLAVDGDDGRSGIAMVTVRLEDGSTSAVGSPDGRRIVAQHRREGEAEWSRPVTVARAPAGQRCRAIGDATQPKVNRVVHVVNCWPQDSEWGDEYSGAPPPSTGFALGSRDGRRWSTEPLVRPGREPDVQLSEPLILVRGAERSVLWRPGTRAFEEVRLPLADPAYDGLVVSGDWAVRVTGNPDGARPCRPTWSVARLDAGER